MLKLAVKTFSGIGCVNPDGCSIIFDKNTLFQTFPSNTSNYFLTINGAIDFNYSDGTKLTSIPLYTSNNWTSYQDVWKYDTSFDAKISGSSDFVAINLQGNTTTSNCTLQIKKIENESFSFSTDKSSALFVFGTNYQYNGNTVTSNTVNKLSGYGNSLGNTKTHEIVATTPLTLIFLEKQ